MARKERSAPATTEQELTCLRTRCGFCGYPIAVAYRTRRTITTLQGSCRLILRVRRCHNPVCEWYHRGFRPEETLYCQVLKTHEEKERGEQKR